MAQTSRRPTNDPDLLLKRVVSAMAEEVSRLKKKQRLQVCCPTCGMEPGLVMDESRWLAQALRDLTRLALGARRMLIERLLRNLNAAGLDAVQGAGTGGNWMPE